MSSILTPIRRNHFMYRMNPVAKFGAAMLLSVGLVLSIDWVSASVALAFEAVLFLFAGLSLRQFALRTLPVTVAAVLGAFTILLYGRASGETHFQFLFIHVTDGSITLAIATFLRVLAIGLPAIVLFVTIDPTDLADGLAQVLHLPARFVIGALAGMRLVGLFLDDWRAMELARRARGVADHGRVRRFFGQVMSLFVLSIRRGSKLATAMEARGFGGPTPRTWARPSSFGGPEWTLLAVAAVVAAVAIWAAVATGHWNFIGAQ